MKQPAILCLLATFLICMLNIPAVAQTPQYAKKHGSAVNPVGFCFADNAVDTTPARKIQFIYEPGKQFPSAPKGYVKAIYFRSLNYIANAKYNSPGYAYNVVMSLGWTKKDTFRILSPTNPNLRDTFLTGLTPVFTAPAIRQNLKDSGTRWMKFSLNGSGFLYDTSQGLNLVAEIVFGPPFVGNYFCLMDSADSGPQQMLCGYRDTPSVYSTLRDPNVRTWYSMDFGFDLTPLGVQAGTFGGSFSLYPNPSNGSFHIDAEAPHGLQEVWVTVRNVTGQPVFHQQYAPNGSEFSAEVKLPDAARGIYFLEMMADGERIVRRIQIE